MKKAKRCLVIVLIMAISCLFLVNDAVPAEAAGAGFNRKNSGGSAGDFCIDEDFKLNYKCKLKIRMDFPKSVDFNELAITIDRSEYDYEEDEEDYGDQEFIFDEEISMEDSPYIKTITLPAGEYTIDVEGDFDEYDYDDEYDYGDQSYKYSLTLTGEYIPELSNKTLTLEEGQTKTLKVKGPKKSVTWKSSNKKIATVSNKGAVKAKKAGTATITAKCGKNSLKCKVTVKKKPLPYSQMAKKLKTFARKNKNFTFKTINAGKECRLYARGVAGSDTSQVDSQGFSMGLSIDPYIQLVKKGKKTELRLRIEGHIIEYSINPTRLSCSKLKATTSNRRMNYTMKQTYGRNTYNYSNGIYSGEIKGYATLSTSPKAKANASGLRKFNTMLGQKSLVIRMTSGDGAYYQFGIPTKARSVWKKLVKEYNTLLKEY